MSPPTPTTVPWRSIRALTLDIYGTLVDWDAGIVRAAHATPLSRHIRAAGSDGDFLRAIEAQHARIERERPGMRKSEINAEGFRAYAREIGVVDDGRMTGEEVEEAAGAFGRSIGGFGAFGDTVDAIKRLSKHFEVVVPLTNMDHFSYGGTLAGPLKGCPFAASYLAEDIGSYKPNLANFRYLFDHLKADYGIEKDEICHVAQSLFHDHEPAKKVGLRSVWVDRYGILEAEGRSWEDVQGEFGMVGRVSSLAELADLVDEALSS